MMKNMILTLLIAIGLSTVAYSETQYQWTDTSTGLTWKYRDQRTLTDSTSEEWEAGIWIGCVSTYNSAIPTSTTGAIVVPSEINGNSVTALSWFAFSDCRKLTSIVLPDSLTVIQEHAFQYCSSLTTLTIPENVKLMQYGMFSGATKLKKVLFKGPPPIFEGYSNTNSSLSPTSGAIGYYSPKYAMQWQAVLGGVSGTWHGLTMQYSPTIAQEIVDGITWYYDVENDNASIFSVTLPEGGITALSIPLTLGSHPVTSIGTSAFYGCTALTSVTIPASVTSIGTNAFSGCTVLTSVMIPASVTSIGESAFRGSGLTSVVIPEGVTTIPYRAFYGCAALTSVTIPTSVTTIGTSAFNGCTSLATLTIPASVTTIGSYAFKEAGLTSLVIPEGVTTIPNYAFYGCTALTSITIPASITSIGGSAFYGCNSLDVTIPTSVTSVGTDAFKDVAQITLASARVPSGMDKSQIQTVIIPEGVTSISDYAFSGCTAITSVTIPSSVTSIGADTFRSVAPTTLISAFVPTGMDKSKIQTVIIPEGITEIKTDAFYGCTAITSVTIPASVTSIGTDAFKGVAPTTLTSAFVPTGMDTSKIQTVIIPEDVTTIPNSAFSGCTALTSVTIPEGVTIIGEEAFKGCSNVMAFTLPKSLKTIGARAFSGCQAVNVTSGCRFYKSIDGVLFTYNNDYLLHYPQMRGGSYVTPINVHFVGEEAFAGNTSLLQVTLTDITSIEADAFNGCSALEQAYVTSGLLTIRTRAFKDCVALHYFTIPASVTNLSMAAFKNCPALDVVSFQGAVPTIEAINNEKTVFSGSDYDQLIGTYPREFKSQWEAILPATLMWSGLKMVADSYYDGEADGYYYQLYGGEVTLTGTVEPLTGDVTLPTVLDGYVVTGIGEAAFAECTEMTGVTIPASIVRLSDYAFYQCRALTAVRFEGYPLTKGEACESPFPNNTTAIGYYPSALKSDWSSVILAGKWYGLTMKSFGTAVVQVSAVVYGKGVVTGTGVLPKGDSFTLTAEAVAGSKFVGWSGDITSVENPLTFTPETDQKLIAMFVPETLVSHVVRTESEAAGYLPQEVVAERVSSAVTTAKASAVSDALEAKEVFTKSSMHDMAFGAPVMEVDQDAVTIAIALKSTDDLSQWSALDLSQATFVTDQATGTVRITVPIPGKAAFYKFVVEPKNQQ